ncbi:hypothetical protein A4V02_03675 [Muribaculum intestinale]|uniref:Uncharacterized protein n=1 Tax=Muribaculum intestinale TaxID=1796646 RepID=A0A1B1S7Y3_9BACT|nr:hypothetical protein A4V02_03675 [Muribaculum intestinale]
MFDFIVAISVEFYKVSSQKIIIRAVARLITQLTPRNIGRRNNHNTNPSIAPIIPTNQRITLFMRLRLEMDALPRLFDMLLFVFIVRHFFYASNRLSKFCLLVDTVACGGKEGLFAL